MQNDEENCWSRDDFPTPWVPSRTTLRTGGRWGSGRSLRDKKGRLELRPLYMCSCCCLIVTSDILQCNDLATALMGDSGWSRHGPWWFGVATWSKAWGFPPLFMFFSIMWLDNAGSEAVEARRACLSRSLAAVFCCNAPSPGSGSRLKGRKIRVVSWNGVSALKIS